MQHAACKTACIVPHACNRWVRVSREKPNSRRVSYRFCARSSFTTHLSEIIEHCDVRYYENYEDRSNLVVTSLGVRRSEDPKRRQA
jgi:hypothetical protein